MFAKSICNEINNDTEEPKVKTKYIASLVIATAVVAAASGGINTANSQNKKNTEACFVKGRAYSTGANACLAISTSPGIEHSCEAHNTWRARNSCATPVSPSGPAYGEDDVEGAVCHGTGGIYSPGFEGCPNGKYQRCEPDGTWLDRGEINGVKCK